MTVQAVTTFSIESIATYDYYPADGYDQVTLSIAVLIAQLLVWVLWLILLRRALPTVEESQQKPWHIKFYIGLGIVVVNALVLFAYHPDWLRLALGSPVVALGLAACSPSRTVFAGIMTLLEGLLSVVAFFMLVAAHFRHPIQLPQVRRLFWLLLVVQIFMAISLVVQSVLPSC